MDCVTCSDCRQPIAEIPSYLAGAAAFLCRACAGRPKITTEPSLDKRRTRAVAPSDGMEAALHSIIGQRNGLNR